MKKIISLAFLVSSCATSPLLLDESVVMTCRLWNVIPATEQRKFIFQGNFTEQLANVAQIAGTDFKSISGACNIIGDPDFKLGKYYPYDVNHN